MNNLNSTQKKKKLRLFMKLLPTIKIENDKQKNNSLKFA